MRRKIYSYCVLIVLLGACKKDDTHYAPSTPDDFTVKVQEKTVYKVGDTVNFELTGSPDMIVFYSGEPGKRYAYQGRISEAGIPKLVFQAAMTQGVLPGMDSMRLLVSTDLKGYDAAGIAAATWTDITSRNTKWPTALSATFKTSDSIDLSDFNQAGQVNLAFRYVGIKNDTAQQRKWQIQNLALTNRTSDGTVTPIFNSFANTGWVECDVKNHVNAWNVGQWNVSASNSVNNSSGIPIRTAYPITFDPGTGVSVDDNEDWLLTSAVDLKTVKPDAGTVIKTSTALRMTSYGYIFKTAGTYTVTFWAVNSRVKGSAGVAREVQITVAP